MLIEKLIVPPGGPLVLLALGFWVGRGQGARSRRLGRALVVLGFGSLYLATTPIVARGLSRSLEASPPWNGEAGELQAVVVLGADIAGPTPEFGGVTVGPLGLERLRFAAAVQRRTGLPLLVTGGSLRVDTPPVAELMQRCLADDFGVPVAWVEDRAGDTAENARRSAELLAEQGITRVGLVTHATHMRRAVRHFEAQRLEVVPMPTAFHGGDVSLPRGLLPSARSLHESALACHEWAGLLWGSLTGWR